MHTYDDVISLEKITVPQFVVVEKRSCWQQSFGHFYLSVAMDEWKEPISPCYCLPGRNKDVDKRLSWLNTCLFLEVKQHSTSCLDSWKSKKGQRLGAPTGSQPVQFLNLFFHLQPVKRNHTDKYYGRQHNSTAVFLQRAENFSPFLPLKTRAIEPSFLAKLGLSPAFSWQWFCVAQIRNYGRRMLWYSAIYMYAILNELEAILDDYNVSASWKW